MKWRSFFGAQAALWVASVIALPAQALVPNYLSVTQAEADYGRRVAEVAKGQIYHYKKMREAGAIGEWDSDVSTRGKVVLREFSAALYAFKNPQYFEQSDFTAISGLGSVPRDQHLQALLSEFRRFSKTIWVSGYVGTEVYGRDVNYGDQEWFPNTDPRILTKRGDFDMDLLEISTIVYSFLDRPDLLPNDVLADLVTLNTKRGSIPYTGQSLSLRSIRIDKEVNVSQPETENHVLMIYQWRFLMNNLVRWIAGLDPSHPRYNERIKAYYLAFPQQYQNPSWFSDWLTTVLTRVSRRGLFETNARAYESFSFMATMNLSSFANAVFPDDPGCKKVATAAANAADYIAANYCFMSYKGKRNLSRRRNWEDSYRNQISLYENDYVSNMMGVLTGSYSYDDRGVSALSGWNKAYPYANISEKDQPSGFAMMASLTGYRVPTIIAKYAVDTDRSWEAVSETKYSREEYNYNWVTSGWPNWRYSDYSLPSHDPNSYYSVKNKVFVAPKFGMFSGGSHDIFLKQTDDIGVERNELKVYNTIAVPNYLVPDGNVGWWGSMSEARNEAMAGSWTPEPSYSNNMHTYKAMAMLPASELVVPSSWQQRKIEGQDILISTLGTFEACATQNGPSPSGPQTCPAQSGEQWQIEFYEMLSGDILVRGLQTKIDHIGDAFPLGFWDVISRGLVAKFGRQNIIEAVRANSSSFVVGKGCTSGIGGDFRFFYARPVASASGVLTVERVGIARHTGCMIQLNKPVNDGEYPLLEVREISPLDYSNTGRKIVENPEIGLLKICDLTGGLGCMEIDSRDMYNPKNNAVRPKRGMSSMANLAPVLNLLLN